MWDLSHQIIMKLSKSERPDFCPTGSSFSAVSIISKPDGYLKGDHKGGRKIQGTYGFDKITNPKRGLTGSCQASHQMAARTLQGPKSRFVITNHF